MPDDVVLDLSTATAAKHIKINGSNYRMMTRNEFGLIELGRMTREWRNVSTVLEPLQNELVDAADIPEADAVAAVASLRAMVRRILPDLPAEFTDSDSPTRLNELDLMEIATVFTKEAGLGKKNAPASTLAPSSRASAVSTVAGRKTG